MKIIINKFTIVISGLLLSSVSFANGPIIITTLAQAKTNCPAPSDITLSTKSPAYFGTNPNGMPFSGEAIRPAAPNSIKFSNFHGNYGTIEKTIYAGTTIKCNYSLLPAMYASETAYLTLQTIPLQ